MKLLTVTSLNYLLMSFIVLLLGTGLFYLRMKRLQSKETAEILHMEESVFKKKYALTALPNGINVDNIGDPITVGRSLTSRAESLKDTLLMDPIGKERIPHRSLGFYFRNRGSGYWITISRSMLEDDSLLHSIARNMLMMLGVLLIILWSFNHWSFKKIWLPFYDIVREMRGYQVDKGAVIPYKKTKITEFNELNKAIEAMTLKIAKDYNSLKEFTENASHELQTPIAIIQSKLDVLIQDKNLSKSQLIPVQSIYENLNRMSNLVYSLLLLAKIDNNQYADFQTIHVHQEVDHQLASLEDWIVKRQITVSHKNHDLLTVLFNKTLLELLLGNLIVNGIKYNRSGGLLVVETFIDRIVISNEGPPCTLSENEIFDRFTKGVSSGSTGLGLAIVKKICEVTSSEIIYTHRNGLHIFTVTFFPRNASDNGAVETPANQYELV